MTDAAQFDYEVMRELYEWQQEQEDRGQKWADEVNAKIDQLTKDENATDK